MPVQKKVTKEIAAAMFKLYEQDTPFSQISRVFGISEVTITKVKKRDRWEERIKEKWEKAKALADKRGIYSLANELTQINGLIPITLKSILHQAKAPRPCPDCSGTGKINAQTCGFCDGQGLVRVLNVSISDYDKLVRLKKDVIEVVTPDLPEVPEVRAPVEDRHAALLDKIEKATLVNMESLGDTIAEGILKPQGKPSDKPQ